MEIKPLYFLAVEEDYLAERFVAELSEIISPPGRGGVNRERISAGSASIAELISALRTPSLFGLRSSDSSLAVPGKLVVVEDADKVSAPEWKRIGPALTPPLEEICLVFVFRPDRFFAWKPPAGVAGAVVKKFRKIKGEKLERWLAGEARNLGLTLEPAATAELISTAGADLRALRQELEKISLYRGKPGRVGAADVRAVSGGPLEGSLFTAIDRALAGRSAEAFPLIRACLKSGEPPLKILHLITRRVLKVWLGREAWEKTRSDDAACRAAGERFYRAEFMKLVRKNPPERFPYMIDRLRRTDLELKGGVKDAEPALERLFLDLAFGP